MLSFTLFVILSFTLFAIPVLSNNISYTEGYDMENETITITTIKPIYKYKKGEYIINNTSGDSSFNSTGNDTVIALSSLMGCIIITVSIIIIRNMCKKSNNYTKINTENYGTLDNGDYYNGD